MQRLHHVFLLLILLCGVGVSGCATPRIELAVASQPNVNPDSSGRPSPVLVKMFELRNDLAFRQADATLLFTQPLQVLGADMIAMDDLMFVPGEARRMRYQPNPNTRFVGVVAGFRHMERASWRTVKPIDPKRKNWISLELNDTTILVIPDREAQKWDPERAVKQFQQQARRPDQSPGVAQPVQQVPGVRIQEAPQDTPRLQQSGWELQATLEEIGLISPDSVVMDAKHAVGVLREPAPAPEPMETITIIRDGVAEIVSVTSSPTLTVPQNFPAGNFTPTTSP